MKKAIAKGDIVKFKNALNAKKAQVRMVILSDPGGGRVLARDISDKNIANCFYIDELELSEKELQAHQ